MKIIAIALTLIASATIAHAQYNPTPVPVTTQQLQDTVAWLYGQVVDLQLAAQNLQGQCNGAGTNIAALQANPVLKLGPYMTFVPSTGRSNPVVIFTGVNIRITKGILTNN